MNFLKDLDKRLEGAPDSLLTGGLLLAGIVAWLVALFGRPVLKATILAWMVAP
jgi:hypothetical protein